MFIYEEVSKDTINRSRVYNKYTCDSCSIEYKKQKRLAEGKPQEHYCSTICYSKAFNYVLLNCANCGISFSKLKSRLSSSKHKIYFCNRKCKDIGQSYIKEIQPSHYGTGNVNYRKLAFSLLDNKCNRCGYFENMSALVVHHIDEIRSNNDISNLEILCANCHAIHHWGSYTV